MLCARVAAGKAVRSKRGVLWPLGTLRPGPKMAAGSVEAAYNHVAAVARCEPVAHFGWVQVEEARFPIIGTYIAWAEKKASQRHGRPGGTLAGHRPRTQPALLPNPETPILLPHATRRLPRPFGMACPSSTRQPRPEPLRPRASCTAAFGRTGSSTLQSAPHSETDRRHILPSWVPSASPRPTDGVTGLASLARGPFQAFLAAPAPGSHWTCDDSSRLVALQRPCPSPQRPRAVRVATSKSKACAQPGLPSEDTVSGQPQRGDPTRPSSQQMPPNAQGHTYSYLVRSAASSSMVRVRHRSSPFMLRASRFGFRDA